MKIEQCPDIAIDRLAVSEPRLAELRDFSQENYGRGICAVQSLHELNPDNLYEVPACQLVCRAIAHMRLN